MGRYFEYKDFELDELCDSIRNRIAEAKLPIPPKKIKHCISIIYRTSETSWTYPSNILSWRYDYDIDGNIKYKEFTSYQEAEKYLNSVSWIEKINDNFWVEVGSRAKEEYITKSGEIIQYHYEIREYDIEVYEDEESHTEYDEDEKKCLSEALYIIEKARAYMRAYDYCCDQYSFGEGGFAKEVKENLDEFNKNYTEELPPDNNSDF